MLQDNPVLGPLVQGLVSRLGREKTRDLIQQGVTMSTGKVDKISVPRPEFGPGAKVKPNVPSSSPPLTSIPSSVTERGFTRGSSTKGVQLNPGALEPRAAETFVSDGQMRIPFTQPGKGGRMYSPLKSSENPEVAGGMMQSRLGDVMDAADFPRFRAAEGQRGIDLEPDVTRQMMQQMAPGLYGAPRFPSSMGVQVTSLKGIDPKLLQRATGLGIISAGVVGKEELADAPQRFEQELAEENKLISDVVAAASQQGGAFAEIVLRNAPRGPENYTSREQYNEVRAEFLDNLTNGRFQQAADLVEQYRNQQAAPQSQQSGESITTERLVAEAGTDDAANVTGNIVYGSESDLAGPPVGSALDQTAERQGASELTQFTEARPQPELRLASSAMMQSIADDIGRRLAAEEDVRNQGYIQARSNLGPNATQAEMDKVRDKGLALFADNFPQFR